MDSDPLQLLVLMPLTGCLVSALSALAILLRAPSELSNRLAAALVGGAAWWSYCQVLWTVAPDAPTAYFWHHASTPGWAFIGPLSVHLLSRHVGASRDVGFLLGPLYGIAGVFALIGLGTPWLHGDPVETPFGWGFVAGPGHVWNLAFTFGCLIPAHVLVLRRVGSEPSPALRQQTWLVSVGIAGPFLLAGAFAGILPLMGIQLPRLGAFSFSIFGVSIAWAYYRYGFSVLADGAFSREILETLPSGLALVGLDGRILSGNERMSQLLGIDHGDLPGFDITAALSVSVLSPPRELRGHECALLDAQGGELAISLSSSLLRDKRNLPIGVVVVVRDLRELVELRKHLITSGRLAAVGELAAGIAHEINNPMAFVRANLSQLEQHWTTVGERLADAERRCADGVDLIDEGRDLLAECVDGVERTVHIVRDVKDFAHGGHEERTWLDLNDLLARALRVAGPQIACEIRVECDFGEIPKVVGAASELQQVFLNLVVNAAQAIEGPGRIGVETLEEGGAVLVRISDDGCGIPPEDCDRIFDPFYTTKPVGVGTGLGLAISFQILESHDAEIRLDSAPGRGTLFEIRFPIGAP